MVAPNYAERRSTLAKQIGLGQKSKVTAERETVSDVPEVQHMPERKRRRK